MANSTVAPPLTPTVAFHLPTRSPASLAAGLDRTRASADVPLNGEDIMAIDQDKLGQFMGKVVGDVVGSESQELEIIAIS